MMVMQSLRIALRSLRVNKLRSALTMLGIIIGVGAVITMVAVGAGATARVAEQIQSLGSNLIIVLSGSVTSSGIRLGTGSHQRITEDDAAAAAREVEEIDGLGAPRCLGNERQAFSIRQCVDRAGLADVRASRECQLGRVLWRQAASDPCGDQILHPRERAAGCRHA